MTAGRALGAAVGAILAFVVLLSACATAVVGLLTGPLDGPAGAGVATGLPDAAGEIPAASFEQYLEAASGCPGLPWSVLAAIGKTESDHGRRAPARGVGRMGLTTLQLSENAPPSSIGDPAAERGEPRDDVRVAARKLCRVGDRTDTRVLAAELDDDPTRLARIVELDDVYRNSPRAGTFLAMAARSAPSPAARIALDYAAAQLGRPYVWGGDGPDRGRDDGFDCSGLTQTAFQAAGIAIPRTATEQFRFGTPIEFGDLKAGDLIFYGMPTGFLHHVAIYVARGFVIDAPHPGAVVRLDPVSAADYAGARRLA